MMHIMENVTMMVCLITFQVLGTNAADAAASDVKRLLHKLFVAEGYNKYVRPTDTQFEPLQLDMKLVLTAINKVDEVAQTLSTTGFIWASWFDDGLKWDPSDYNDTNYIIVSQKEVWKPDLALDNGVNKINQLGNDFINVYVESDGLVTWYPSEVFETQCQIDITYFPFDVQRCDIMFTLWVYFPSDIELKVIEEGIALYDFDDHDDGMWSIVDTWVEGADDIYNVVVYSILLKRSSKHYVMTLVLPIILMNVLTVFTFALPAECGEKIGYSMTLFLSFAVFLSILSNELPKARGAILVYYMMFELAVGTFIVVVTTLELRLHHRNGPVPERIARWVRGNRFCAKKWEKLSCTSCFEKKRVDASVIVASRKSNKDSEENKEIVSWCAVISKLDFVLFWVMLVLTTVINVTVIMLLYNHGE